MNFLLYFKAIKTNWRYSGACEYIGNSLVKVHRVCIILQ